MIDDKLNTLEKQYVLSSYIIIKQIDMYNVPILKNMSERISDRWAKYHCKTSDHDGAMMTS